MSRFIECKKCHGTGDRPETWWERLLTFGLFYLFPMECRHCNGLGGKWE